MICCFLLFTNPAFRRICDVECDTPKKRSSSTDIVKGVCRVILQAFPALKKPAYTCLSWWETGIWSKLGYVFRKLLYVSVMSSVMMETQCCEWVSEWKREKEDESVLWEQAWHCGFFLLGTASLLTLSLAVVSVYLWRETKQPFLILGSGPPSLALTVTRSVTLQAHLLSKWALTLQVCLGFLWFLLPPAVSVKKLTVVSNTDMMTCFERLIFVFVPPALLFSRCSLSTKLKVTAALCQSSPSRVLPTHLREKCEYFTAESITGKSRWKLMQGVCRWTGAYEVKDGNLNTSTMEMVVVVNMNCIHTFTHIHTQVNTLCLLAGSMMVN